MEQQERIEEQVPAYAEAHEFLAKRGIQPDNGSYTTRQLARELTRRGWRWNLDDESVRATKAYTPSGTVSQTYVAHGQDQVALFTSVLAKAIRFDDEHGLSLVRPYQADIVVRAPDGRIVALVEVKNSLELTSALATQYRRDLIVHDRLDPQAPFFLLLSQDVGYMWDRWSGQFPVANPSATLPMDRVVARYLPWLEPDRRLGEQELILTTVQWLEDLASRREPHRGGWDSSFLDTRFLDAIEGAVVTTNLRG